ncbi:MAG: hypothetical protein J1E65_02920 [Lachnospiraceae bacterium]|nr:hypothetical protein [Lachnospiraceae bacterium]
MANKFWEWLFGKKRIKAEEQEEDWEQIVYERDRINLHNAEERKRYLENCMEQIKDAERELELLTGEYNLVTAYLTDMEEIESLPPAQMSELKGVAGKMLTLNQEKNRYLDKERHLTDSEYRQIHSVEREVEEGIGKLQEAEKYQKLVKQDLSRLDSERHAYAYRRSELNTMLVNLRGMAVICLTALGACILMLLVLQLGFHLDTVIGYYLSVAAAAIAITVIFIKYKDAERELDKVGKTVNKLILLQNKVKIRYVNNTQLLDYLYMKYAVESADDLKDLWTLYQEEKEERRQFAEADAKLDYHREELRRLLVRYRVKDPDRWTAEPDALLDSREMIEIRHGLIIRRQALRKQMDYNRNLAETAGGEIRDIAAEYPQYAMEITAMVERYEQAAGSAGEPQDDDSEEV